MLSREAVELHPWKHWRSGWVVLWLDLLKDVLPHCRGLYLDDCQRSLPTQSILSFYEFALHFCWVGHAQELTTILEKENWRLPCRVDTLHSLEDHWGVVYRALQALPPFLDAKGESHRKSQRKWLIRQIPQSFSCPQVSGYPFLNGIEKKHCTVSFLELPLRVCTGSIKGQLGKKRWCWEHSALGPGWVYLLTFKLNKE